MNEKLSLNPDVLEMNAADIKYPTNAESAKTEIENNFMLKEVPKHRKVTDHGRKNEESDALGFDEDPRWVFFKNPENRYNHYYVIVRGGPGKNSHYDNALKYLGNFDKIVEKNLWGSNLRDAYRHYNIWFKNAGPMSSQINENDELYYATDQDYMNEYFDDMEEMGEIDHAYSRWVDESNDEYNRRITMYIHWIESKKAERKTKAKEITRLKKMNARNTRRKRRQEMEKEEEEESRRLAEALHKEEENRISKNVGNHDKEVRIRMKNVKNLTSKEAIGFSKPRTSFYGGTRIYKKNSRKKIGKNTKRRF
jgi:hypothetical protein